MIQRDYYLGKIISAMWNGDIKVITGIRRCGKSTLLFYLFYDYLLKNGIQDNQIIKIELDQRRYYEYRNPIALCKYVEKIVTAEKNKQFYLLIDEVQFTESIKDRRHGNIVVTIYDMLNELKAYPNLDVYVTGSNSKMLSSDISTAFRGRATQIHIYPLSFSEFYSFRSGDEREVLGEYMLYGGMPGLLVRKNDDDKADYLTGLYSELYIKDIEDRFKIENPEVLNQILDYLASQIGSLSNPTNIANAIASFNKEMPNHNTVAKYIEHAVDAFLIAEVKRYNIKGKSYFSYPSKFYYTDIGLRNARLNFRQFDAGHIMENIIYNELICRGYRVDVGVAVDRTNGQCRNREVDFIVNNRSEKVYIQSAWEMSAGNKSDSELNSLKIIGDFSRKIVIRNDIPKTYSDESGILQMTLRDFLLKRVSLF